MKKVKVTREQSKELVEFYKEVLTLGYNLDNLKECFSDYVERTKTKKRRELQAQIDNLQEQLNKLN